MKPKLKFQKSQILMLISAILTISKIIFPVQELKVASLISMAEQEALFGSLAVNVKETQTATSLVSMKACFKAFHYYFLYLEQFSKHVQIQIRSFHDLLSFIGRK